MVVISTKMSELGEEQFSSQFHKDGLVDVAYSPELRQAVSASSTGIKVRVRVAVLAIFHRNPSYTSCESCQLLLLRGKQLKRNTNQ